MSSRYADDMIDLCARLRLACEAIDIKPDDVRLDDLCDAEQDRLRFLAEKDFRDIVNAQPLPTCVRKQR